MDAHVSRPIDDRGTQLRVVNAAGSGGGDRPLRVARRGREQIADAILRAPGPRPWKLFLVVIVMTVSLVVTFCLAAPEVGPMVRPWAVEQVASIGAIDSIEQARVKKDWDTMQDQAEQASSATERLARGPAIVSLVGWSASPPTLRKLRDDVHATTENLREVQKTIREKDEIRLSTSLRELRNSYEPVRDVSKRSPALGRERSPG